MSVMRGNPAVLTALLLALSIYGAVRAEGFWSEPAPAGMEVEWQSVPTEDGAARAWVREDLILIESANHILSAIRRADGVHLWRCELENSPKFPPAASRNNVLVNVDNYLVALDKRGGNIRWKQHIDYIMSTEPLIFDPALYPKEYTNQWQNLETIIVAGWDSRIHSFFSRGKMTDYLKNINTSNSFAAPNFDIFPIWLKANKNGALTNTPIRYRDGMLYYLNDANYICSVSRDGDEKESYYMLGAPSTNLTVTSGSMYVADRNNYVYCIDRLIMRKKWSYAAGKLAHGTIFADELATPLVYIPMEDNTVQSLRITPAKFSKKGELDSVERFKEFWSIPGQGVVTCGPLNVYVGSSPVGSNAYKSVSAVDKATGKSLWTLDSHGQYLEYHNSWSNEKQSSARIYGVGADGRVTSFKEKKRDTGIQIAKLPVEAQAETPKMIMVKKKEAEGEAKPDEKKPEEKKPDEKKADEAKPAPAEPKKDESKKEDAPK